MLCVGGKKKIDKERYKIIVISWTFLFFMESNFQIGRFQVFPKGDHFFLSFFIFSPEFLI